MKQIVFSELSDKSFPATSDATSLKVMGMVQSALSAIEDALQEYGLVLEQVKPIAVFNDGFDMQIMDSTKRKIGSISVDPDQHSGDVIMTIDGGTSRHAATIDNVAAREGYRHGGKVVPPAADVAR